METDFIHHHCRRPIFARTPPVFAHPFFNFCALSTPRWLSQFCAPKFPLFGTSDLVFLVEKRQLAGAGFWGQFCTGSPHRKQRKIAKEPLLHMLQLDLTKLELGIALPGSSLSLSWIKEACRET